MTRNDYSEDLGRFVENTIPPALVRKWERALKRVNSVMEEIIAECPAAHVYLESEGANLMYGPDHEGPGGKQQQHRVVDSVLMRKWGGGAW